MITMLKQYIKYSIPCKISRKYSVVRSYDTLDEAYIGCLKDVLYNYDENNLVYEENEINRRPKYEKHNYAFYIKNPSLNILKTNSIKRNKQIKNYFEKEKIIFDNGDLKSLTNLGNIWKNITNPDGTINANYGHMVYHIKDAGNKQYAPNDELLCQYDWAKKMLLKRLTTKQAYLHFNRPQHQWLKNRDQPCTMFIQYLVSTNNNNYQLNLCSNMRSNDLVRGTPYNIMYFFVLFHRMLNDLKSSYPNLKLGYYYHHATSLHIYHHDVELVKSMIDGEKETMQA